MAVRTTPVGSAVASQQAAAATMNGAAGGWIGYVEVIADQVSITSEVALSGLTVAVTVGTSRRIRVRGVVSAESTVADDTIALFVKESTTYLQTSYCTVSALGRGDTLMSEVILTPSVGAHTYYLTLARSAGSGTLTLKGSATRVCFLVVEDVGPA